MAASPPDPNGYIWDTEITCPNCGYRHRDSWEFGDGEKCIECHNCEKLLEVQQVTIIEYGCRVARKNTAH